MNRGPVLDEGQEKKKKLGRRQEESDATRRSRWWTGKLTKADGVWRVQLKEVKTDRQDPCSQPEKDGSVLGSEVDRHSNDPDQTRDTRLQGRVHGWRKAEGGSGNSG